MWRKTWVLILVTLSVGTVFIQPVLGKDYPTKPITIVVPFQPGSGMDALSRLIAETAPKYLGQSIVVENKTGAGGSIAAADVISSKPDGYKLFTADNFFFALTSKTQKIPFDPYQLVPLANFLKFKDGLLVRNDSPWKTFNDVLDHARKNPGKLTWGHAGQGVTNHIAMTIILRKAGVKAVDVPYKGSPERLTALLGGHVDTVFSTRTASLDYVRSGKIRYLFVINDQRFSDLPHVPSVAEIGFPEAAKLAAHVGLFIHKDTPEEIKKTLIEAMKKTYEDPGFRKGIGALGEEPKFGGPEFLNGTIKDGEEICVPILKELGLYVGK